MFRRKDPLNRPFLSPFKNNTRSIKTQPQDIDLIDPAQEVSKWLQTPPSTGTLRLLLCGDLTVIQGALLSSWAFVAWVLGLHTVNLHQIAVYGGVFCVQYIMLISLRFLYAMIDSWNFTQNQPVRLKFAQRPLDVLINVVGPLSVWLLVMGVSIFSGFHLRVIPLNSFVNCVISGCAFGNYVLLLHASGTILSDCDAYTQPPAGVPQSPGHSESQNGFVVRMSIGIWTVVIRMVIVFCQGIHLLAHIWPLADTMLVSCLVALGIYMARRSLDDSWRNSKQVQQARLVAHESRHLIWPVVLLLGNYICDVILSTFKLTQQYALKFLISVSAVGNGGVGGTHQFLDHQTTDPPEDVPSDDNQLDTSTEEDKKIL